MRYLDLKNKDLHWYNRNVFYVGTVVVVMINVLVFLIVGKNWGLRYESFTWGDVLNFNNLLVCFLSAFEHSNWQHCLLNSLCFLIAGTYVERKIGTVNLLILVLVFALFGEGMIDANDRGGGSVGFSGVNYAFYAYIIVDYAFMFIHKKQNKADIIYGAVIVALIYLACCFCGGTSRFAFKAYPHDLITNQGHYTAFLTGTILTLLLQFIKWQTKKENN